MRNPLPVLAAALLAAVGAFATDLPKWQTKDESFSAWRVIEFKDASGANHYLYCRWSECGANVKSGQATLYALEKASDEHYMASAPYNPQHAGTYAGKTWEWLKGKTTDVQFQSTKTTFMSEVSRFALDMSSKPNKAVIKGTNVAIPVEPEHEAVSETGWIFRVLQPVAVADDAPKPAPAKPGPVASPRRRSKTPPAKPKKHGKHTATKLSTLERFWLIPPERAAYDASINAAKKPSASALQAAYRKGRETVATNLREELKKPYNDLVAAGTFDKIEDLLTGKNYSGDEVALRPEEYEALKTVLKTADAHTDFKAPNAAGQYDIEHLPYLAPDGKVNLNEHLMAHRVTEKFRDMRPKKPGDAVNPFAPLTDADFARIPDKVQREALKKQYDEAWAKADTNEKKTAVNKDFRAKIDQLVAAATSKPSTPFNPGDITSLDKLKALAPDDQKKFCSALSSDAGALANCGDILGNADAAVTKCMGAKGDNPTSMAKAKSDCMAKVNACKVQASGTSGIPSSNLPKDMRDYCAKFLADASGPTPPISSGGLTKTPSGIDTSPCPGSKVKAGDPGAPASSDTNPCPKKPEKAPSDPNFLSNVGNGMMMGLSAMLLGSFFGGPLLMLAVGIAAGIGGYFVSKKITAPDDK